MPRVLNREMVRRLAQVKRELAQKEVDRCWKCAGKPNVPYHSNRCALREKKT